MFIVDLATKNSCTLHYILMIKFNAYMFFFRSWVKRDLKLENC